MTELELEPLFGAENEKEKKNYIKTRQTRSYTLYIERDKNGEDKKRRKKKKRKKERENKLKS